MLWNLLSKIQIIFSVTSEKIISIKSFLDKNKNVQTQIFLNFCKNPFFQGFLDVVNNKSI